MLLPSTCLPPSMTSFMCFYHQFLSLFWLLFSASCYPQRVWWMSAQVTSSQMQIPLEHNSLLIGSCEQRWIKNIQDALLAARLPASECIKYHASTPHKHTHTHTQAAAWPPYLRAASRHHQWIAFMQNASITGKTKRPCQGRGVVTGAGTRFYAVLIWAAISP